MPILSAVSDVSAEKREVVKFKSERYDRHVFLCYKTAADWHYTTEFEPLPDLFEDAIIARMGDMALRTKLTIFDGGDDCTEGDVLIFPEMTKHKGLEVANVDSFVEDVLVNGKPWASQVHEVLTGCYIFVCVYALDKTCAVCGPLVIETFKEEIDSRKLKHQLFVYPCFNLGAHEVYGNVIIFKTPSKGNVYGNWFGYVSPFDVAELLDEHIAKGVIIRRLWRGLMGPYKKEGSDQTKFANGTEGGFGSESSGYFRDANGNNEISEGIEREARQMGEKIKEGSLSNVEGVKRRPTRQLGNCVPWARQMGEKIKDGSLSNVEGVRRRPTRQLRPLGLLVNVKGPYDFKIFRELGK